MSKALSKGQRTKAQLVEATAKLLQAQGYYATGLKQVLTESGAPRGSLYFHFPGGKEELACAALVASGTSWRTRLEAAVDEADSLASALQRVCETLAKALEDSKFQDGCPIATTTLEAAATIDTVHQICSDHFQSWQDYVADRLALDGIPQEQQRPLATLVISSIEGALLLSRAHRDTTPLHEVASTLTTFVVGLPRE